jgi:hypothetical protein
MNGTPEPAVDLLAELEGLGIELEADGDRLRFRPRDKVTADVAAQMKEHKAELLALLERREAVSRRLRADLAAMTPHETADGRMAWTHPQYRRKLEALGLIDS